jgi:hypothetical protein
MTMPYGSAEEPDAEVTAEASMPVRVVSSGEDRRIAAEFGQWRTFTITSTLGPQVIFPRSLRRKRGSLFVVASTAGQPVTDGVILGSQGLVGQNSGPLAAAVVPGGPGGYLPIGTSYPYEAQQELYAACPSTNVNTVYITICDEQWASPVPRKGSGI